MTRIIDIAPDGSADQGADLPPAARAELVRALILLRGGNRLARAAGAMARVVGYAAGPLMRLGSRVAAQRPATLNADGATGGSSRASLQPVIEAALTKAFDVAIMGLAETERFATPGRARFAAALSGAAGGAVGLPGFLPDAAFTTLLILRNIAGIARDEGEDPSSEETRRACLEVFTFGSPSTKTRSAPGQAMGDSEQGYWGARLILQGSPIVKLITEAASRFGLALSEKLALQAVPIAGAAGGALVNTAFLDHYRALAQGHFIMRRLERVYGATTIRNAAGEMSG